MILSNKGIAKALIRLHGCSGWSAPLLFTNTEDRFSRVEAHMINVKQFCLRKKLKQTASPDPEVVWLGFLFAILTTILWIPPLKIENRNKKVFKILGHLLYSIHNSNKLCVHYRSMYVSEIRYFRYCKFPIFCKGFIFAKHSGCEVWQK